MVLAYCQCIEQLVIIFPSEKHNISKVKRNILEILILLFDFLYFDVELFKYNSSYMNSTGFIFISDCLTTNISLFQESRTNKL